MSNEHVVCGCYTIAHCNDCCSPGCADTNSVSRGSQNFLTIHEYPGGMVRAHGKGVLNRLKACWINWLDEYRSSCNI